MDDYRSSLKVVGIILIIVGFLDIGWMIWCITHGQGYSSSFNIFAVIAGILLMRGSLRTANVVASFSAFFLSGLLGVVVIIPFLVPFDLVLAYLRVYPLYVMLGLFFFACTLVLLGWIYRRLTTPPILAAIAEEHPQCTKFWRRPSTGFLSGIPGGHYLSCHVLFHGARCESRARDCRGQEEGWRGLQVQYHFLEYAIVQRSFALFGSRDCV
jgi:hypothetical protein